ncbi:MAG: FAD-dependent oxidoreductase [Poseidonibacter sp.]|uniref:FAD-dependent oxidoreductase n=1 Tax=Poseidonibacter sp. TaxID=2321188 RepID=UPI00359EAEDA
MIDVLIIGSGAAGLTAAINAKENGSNVLVISKTYPTHSQTVQAQGGINAVIYDDNDSIDTHIDDTYKASKNLAYKENIKYMCQNAKDTIKWLDSIGVPFNRDKENKFAQRKFGGTKKIRTCYSSDYTGLKILHTLYDQCIKCNIKFENEHLLLSLIIQNNKCIGIIALDIQSGIVKEFIAKTVIIASGGYGGIFSNNTTNSYSNTADGIAISYKAGVHLSNMEFVQFHPTTLLNTNILISESSRAEGGYLLDQNQNRFIDELESRDKVARAIQEKIQNNEQVFLDLRHLGLEKINKLMPQERRLALEFSNIKLENELLPINPSAHYTMGGINTDINCKTNIKNLYACGEVAQAGIHGANRLGGNSLLEIVTFGKVAGLNASKESNEMNEFDIKNTHEYLNQKEYISSLFTKENSIDFYKEKENLSHILFENVGLFRDEEKLNKANKYIEELKSKIEKMGISDKSQEYNKNLVEYIEFLNILNVSHLVVNSAINRKESRGSHFRTDYKNEDKNFEKLSISFLQNNKDNLFFKSLYEN